MFLDEVFLKTIDRPSNPVEQWRDSNYLLRMKEQNYLNIYTYENVTVSHRKQQRKPKDSKIDIRFENPAYHEDPIYETIPEDIENSAMETLTQETSPCRHAVDINSKGGNILTNIVLHDQSEREHYAVPQGGRDLYYASLAGQVDQRLKQRENKARNEENYMMLVQGKITRDGTPSDEIRYMKPVVGHYAIPLTNADQHDQKTVNLNYENAQCNFGNYQDQSTRDLSGANAVDEDYMRPVDLHYPIPRRKSPTERASDEPPFSDESQVWDDIYWTQ